MKEPETPVNEEGRLKVLHSLKILDTDNEERFDRITRIARTLFQAPIALFSLVDQERQWFKSCIGVDQTETPRSVSFCGHAILENGTFHIPNALEDERFVDNPLVTGPMQVRFYIGQPIMAPGGECLGTLCILDTKPRGIGQDAIAALCDLAKIVESEIASLHMATVDRLTGLSNRRGIEILGEQALNLSQRTVAPLTCVFFDLNKFKPINDEYGHDEGDKALKIFSEELLKAVRESDIVARLGGDEFVALINSDTELTKMVVDRFNRSLAARCTVENLPYKIESCAGMMRYDPIEHPYLNALLSATDKEMYKLKRGR